MEDPTVHVCCKGISNWSKPYRNSFFTRSWISTVRIGFIASGAQQESWTAFSPTFPQIGALWQLTAAEGASFGGLERAEAGSGWAVHLHKILKRSLDICVNWATSAETPNRLVTCGSVKHLPKISCEWASPCRTSVHQRYQFHGVDLFARKQAFTRPIRIEDITGPWIDVTPLGGNGNGFAAPPWFLFRWTAFFVCHSYLFLFFACIYIYIDR